VRATAVFGLIVVIASATLARSQRLELTLELQAMCETQARNVFQQMEDQLKKDPYSKDFKRLSSDYQSHYNAKINKCLMLMEVSETLGDDIIQRSTSSYLIDAYERRDMASYLWISRKNKSDEEVPPMTCELALAASDQKKKNCTTREEFDAFVAEYMEK
jgi:hypothetical protein